MTDNSQPSLRASIAEAATPARVRLLLTLFLVVVFVLLQLWPHRASAPDDLTSWRDDGRLHVFVHPDCPHCHEAQNFLRTRPEIDVAVHDVSTQAGRTLYREVATALRIADGRLSVPLFVFGDRFIIGFDRPERGFWLSSKQRVTAPPLRHVNHGLVHRKYGEERSQRWRDRRGVVSKNAIAPNS